MRLIESKGQIFLPWQVGGGLRLGRLAHGQARKHTQPICGFSEIFSYSESCCALPMAVTRVPNHVLLVIKKCMNELVSGGFHGGSVTLSSAM